MLPECIIFDLETTGFYPGEHEIIEIGAVRVTPDVMTVLGEFHRKVRPEHPERAAKEALRLNGYTPAGWQDARPLEAVLQEFSDFLRGGIVAGYNVAFDWNFIEHEFRRLRIEPDIDYHRIDVFSIALETALKQKPQLASWTLTDMCTFFGVDRGKTPHRALTDAHTTWRLWKKLRHHA